MSFDEWLDSTTYSQSRKADLRQCHDELRGGAPTRKQCQKIKSFAKTEGYTEYKNIRWINSRSDHFKVYSGPYFKAIEKEVYSLPSFIKHTPVSERPAKVLALKQSGVRYFATDFTSFESHFTPAIMDAIELELYRHCLQDYPEVSQVITSAIGGENRLRMRNGFSAVLKGRRMSGDMCTSLGNGFTNLVLASYLADKQGHSLTGFVEGDDGLFATKAVLTKEQYQRIGFRIKIEEIDDPCTASFCGMVFSESGEIIKDPKKFMGQFGWTSSFISAGEEIMLQLLRAKALSAVYETPQCPILGALARRALIKTRGVLPRWVDDGYHKCPPDEFVLPPFKPSDDTRLLFAELYGISPFVQLEIEARVMAGNYFISDLVIPPKDQIHYSTRYVERT